MDRDEKEDRVHTDRRRSLTLTRVTEVSFMEPDTANPFHGSIENPSSSYSNF